MIVDVFTYNGEKEILDIHINTLKDVVDQFIICEAPTTFSGKPKSLYYDKERYKDIDIKYFVIDEQYTPDELALAESSPNTQGAEHWKREFLQKESIKKALTHLKDSDTVFIGDVDEIWYPDMATQEYKEVIKFKLNVYAYYVNNKSDEQFWGTIVGQYKDIKHACLNHLRTDAPRTYYPCGWHFTSMGGYEQVRRKLSDSYTRESYWTEEVENNLKGNFRGLKDFLGRGFSYEQSEVDLPQYLLDNKDIYGHLFR
jgi:hypothetical protein